MPFVNPPHPSIRRWDRCASEAAVIAQFLYMNGKLDYPFDRTEFDKLIKRKPREFLYSAEWLRIIRRQLPTVHVQAVGPPGYNKVTDADTVRRIFRRSGISEQRIAQHLASALYQNDVAKTVDIQAAVRELGSRYRTVVCLDGNRRAGILLQSEVAIIADDQTDPTEKVLIVPSRMGKDVVLFRPNQGVIRATFKDLLLRGGIINLNISGFMAYVAVR